MRTAAAASFLICMPSAVFACTHGAHAHGGCGFAATFLMALTAALGYGVLRYAEKDHGLVRWAGRVVGWLLLVCGLLGFTCGVASHVKKSTCRTCAAKKTAFMKCHGGGDGYGSLPEDHPDIDKTGG